MRDTLRPCGGGVIRLSCKGDLTFSKHYLSTETLVKMPSKIEPITGNLSRK